MGNPISPNSQNRLNLNTHHLREREPVNPPRPQENQDSLARRLITSQNRPNLNTHHLREREPVNPPRPQENQDSLASRSNPEIVEVNIGSSASSLGGNQLLIFRVAPTLVISTERGTEREAVNPPFTSPRYFAIHNSRDDNNNRMESKGLNIESKGDNSLSAPSSVYRSPATILAQRVHAMAAQRAAQETIHHQAFPRSQQSNQYPHSSQSFRHDDRKG